MRYSYPDDHDLVRLNPKYRDTALHAREVAAVRRAFNRIGDRAVPARELRDRLKMDGTDTLPHRAFRRGCRLGLVVPARKAKWLP